MELLPIYPRETHRAGGVLRGAPMLPIVIAAPRAQKCPGRLMPRTQLERDRQAASHGTLRPRPSPFLLPPRSSHGGASPAATGPRQNVTSRFGQRIRRLRVERNLTQTRMAEEFGIDRTFLSDVECGRKSVTLGTLETIARGFNLTLSELLKDV